MISDLIKYQIKKQVRDVQIESCGVVIGGLVRTDAIALRNSHPDPTNDSRIDHNQLAKFNYENIRAFWHTHILDSHPAFFTYTDIEMSHQTLKPIILYHTKLDSWDYYEPNNPNPFPLDRSQYGTKQPEFYEGIPFHWGRSDCFSIVRRYLLGMTGVDTGEFTRSGLDNFPPKDYVCPFDFGRHLQLVPAGTRIKKHDVFAIALKGGTQPNHAAVLVDPEQNLILHSMSPNSHSKIEPYSRYLRERTVRHYRLRRLC